MANKDVSELLAEKVKIKRDLDDLHDKYIKERAELISSVRTKYEKERKILENKIVQLHKLISGNVEALILGATERTVDDSWQYKTADQLAEEWKDK